MNDNGARDPRNDQWAVGEDVLDNTEAIDDGAEQETAPQRDLAAEYLDALLRERAAFLNYKRRAEAEREEAAHKAVANLLKKLLPVVDDFDRALAHMPDDAQGSAWAEGVLAIARKLHAVLESEGIERIESLGQPFDPNLHEAVAFDDSGEGGHDTVSEVYAHGYRKGDRVIRPAMVRVSRG